MGLWCFFFNEFIFAVLKLEGPDMLQTFGKNHSDSSIATGISTLPWCESEFTVQGLAGVGYLASNAMYTVDAGHMSLKVGESFLWVGMDMNRNGLILFTTNEYKLYDLYKMLYVYHILYIHILYIVYTYIKSKSMHILCWMFPHLEYIVLHLQQTVFSIHAIL